MLVRERQEAAGDRSAQVHGAKRWTAPYRTRTGKPTGGQNPPCACSGTHHPHLTISKAFDTNWFRCVRVSSSTTKDQEFRSLRCVSSHGNDLCSNTLNEFENWLQLKNGAGRQVTWPWSSLARPNCNLRPRPGSPSGYDNMNRHCGGITEFVSGSHAPAGRGWFTSHGAISSRL